MKSSIDYPINYVNLRSALDLLKEVSKAKEDREIYPLLVWIKLKGGDKGESGN